MLPSTPLGKIGSDMPSRVPEATASGGALVHRDRGKTAWSQGAYDQAIAEFNEALRENAADAESCLLRGEVYAAQGDHERAIADFSDSINIYFNRVLSSANRVLFQTSQHQFEEAVADASETLQLNQRLAQAYLCRGRAYVEREEYLRAVVDYTQVIALQPTNSEAFAQRGVAFGEMGDHARAVADFSEALRLDPSNISTWSKRGRAFHKQGQYDRAIADFTQTLQLAPECPETFADRGAAHLEKGDYDRALDDYNRSIHLDPRSARSHLQRSRIHAARGDYERALADFAKALALDPRNHFSHENQDIARRLKEEYDQSLDKFNRVRSDFQRAVTTFAQAMDLDPRPIALPPLGQRLAVDAVNGLAEQMSPKDEAACEARPLLYSPAADNDAEDDTTLKPESEASSGGLDAPRAAAHDEARSRAGKRAAEEHCRQAQSHHSRGEHKQALQEYTMALRLAPDCLTAYLERGRLYRTTGHFDRAIADFTAALGIEEGNAEAYLRRGNAYVGKGEHESAITDYSTAIELAPTLAAAYMNRGLAFARLGEFDKTLADADRALQLNPRLAGALFLRGTAYFKQGRSELALADFDMLLLLEPDHVLAYNERGLVRAAREEYDLAIDDYTQALQREPKFDLALFNRALAHRLRGDHDSAIAEFSALIERAPANALAYYHRGLGYFAKKELDRAIADLTRAFQIDPKCKQAYLSCLEVIRAKHERQPSVLASPPKGETIAHQPDNKLGLARGAGVTESAPSASDEAVGTVEKKKENKEKPNPPKIPPGAEKRTPVVNEGTAANALAETQAETPRAAVEVGKLRLECPQCGTLGLLNVRNLTKAFRCPGCSNWWRTDSRGRLIEASPTDAAGLDVEVRSNTGGWSKHRVPMPEKPAPDGKPPSRNGHSTRKAPPLPARKRQRSSDGALRYAGNWIAAASATRTGRWVLAGVLIFALASVGFAVSPLLWPGQLKTRGETMARAWLAKDINRMEQLTEPSQAPYLPSWLEHHQPPDLTGQEPAPVMRIAVERNDGKTADVVIQIAAKDKKGQPAHYVFHHRWVDKGDGWYFHPQEAKKSLGPAVKTTNTRKNGRR